MVYWRGGLLEVGGLLVYRDGLLVYCFDPMSIGWSIGGVVY